MASIIRGSDNFDSGAGGVTSLNGQTGAITNTGVGSIGQVCVMVPNTTSTVSSDSTYAGSGLGFMNCIGYIRHNGSGYVNSTSGSYVTLVTGTGTWRSVGGAAGVAGGNYGGNWVRVS